MSKFSIEHAQIGIIEGEGFPADPPVIFDGSDDYRRVYCAHGFTKDCPTCAHFAKVRESE